jgi:hypothetical protein
MDNILDQALDAFLRRALKRFEERLRQEKLTEENVSSRVRGAKQFVAFVFGRYRGKHMPTVEIRD